MKKTTLLIALPLLIGPILSSCGNNDSGSEKQKQLVTISIASNPNKTAYKVNEVLDLTGLKVVANYSDSSTKDVTSQCNVSSPDMSSEGTKTITVTYLDKVTSFSITVSKDEPGNPYKEKFDRLTNTIKTNHNYEMDITSYTKEYPALVFTDKAVAINNKAYYTNGEEGSIYDHIGIIYQKDQGYIYFKEFSNLIISGNFYCTNPNIGISDIYEAAAENIFNATFTQDETDKSLFKTSDATAIAIASSYSGYSGAAGFVAPSEMSVKVDANSDKLHIEFEYTLYYLDESYEKVVEHGIASYTIGSIGLAENKLVSNYISNPSYVYTTPTDWESDEKDYFKNYYNNFIPSFIKGASYAYSSNIPTESEYDGYHLRTFDYACGDIRSSYGDVLVSKDGYIKSSDNLYVKTVKDSVTKIKTMYYVAFTYHAPSEKLGNKTYGYYYPKGELDINFYMKQVSDIVASISEFNDYIARCGYDAYVPSLPECSGCTSISNFEDTTSKGPNRVFTTSNSFIKIYIPDFDTAKSFAQSYGSLLEEYKFNDIQKSSLGFASYYYEGSTKGSYVYMTDFSLGTVTKDNYSGYIQLRFTVYDDVTPRPTPVVPGLFFEKSDDIVSCQFVDLGNNPITQYDVTKDDGYFFANIVVKSGYRIDSITIKEDPEAYVSYDPVSARWEFKPSKEDLSSITVKAITSHNGFTVSSASDMVGGKIVFIGISDGAVVEEGQLVKFSCKADEGYEFVSVSDISGNNVTLYNNPMGGPTSFYFNMIEGNVVLKAIFQKIGGGEGEDDPPVVSDDPLVKLGTIVLTENSDENSVIELTFHEDGTATEKAIKKNAVFGDKYTIRSFKYTKSLKEGSCYTINVSDISIVESTGSISFGVSTLTLFEITYNSDCTSIDSLKLTSYVSSLGATYTFEYKA